MVIGTTGLGYSGNPVPLNYSALRAAPDLVVEQYIAHNLFFRTRNRYPFMAFLELLSRQGMQNYTVDGKKVNWFIGDEEPTTITLGANFATNTSTITLTSDFNHFPIGTVFMLKQNLTDGGSESYPFVIVLRTTSTPTLGASGYVYSVEKIRCHREDTLAAPSGTITFTPAARGYVLSHMAPWDGEAGEYIQRRPASIFNIMQRSRECVGEGKWQMSEQFYTDIRLMRQAQDKMYNMLTKLDKQLLLNHMRVVPGYYTSSYTNSIEGAQFAGLPFYLQPGRYNGGNGPSAADVSNGLAPYVGLRGQIHGVAASTLTYDKLNYYMHKVTQFGEDLKICVGSPANITLLKSALNGVTGFRTYSEKFVFPGTDSIWEMDAVQLDAGRIAFLPDHNLDDVPMYIHGTDPETGVEVVPSLSNLKKWWYFIDPRHIGLAYLNVKDEGPSRIRMYDVTPVNRSSIIRKEIEVGLSLIVSEIRAHGMLYLNA